MKNRQLKVTYTQAFKQKVVNQIENGILTKSGARRLYNIGGSTTIQRCIGSSGNGKNKNRFKYKLNDGTVQTTCFLILATKLISKFNIHPPQTDSTFKINLRPIFSR